MKKPRLFPGIVFGLLGLNAAVVGITLYLAHSDRSFAVEPDYYQKAMAWDSAAAQRERSAALGWTASLTVGDPTSAGRVITLTLTDRSGAPIQEADASIIAFHNARAADHFTANLRPTETPGRYAAALPLERPGLWEFRISAARGQDSFATVIRRDLAGAAP